MVKLSIFLSILVSLVHPVISSCPDGAEPLPATLGSNWPCISLRSTSVIFTDAEYYCEEDNGRQFSIPNGYVNIITADLINTGYPSSGFWIGVTRMVGGVWRNIDNGQNITFSNWASGEPSNHYGYNCVYMDSQGYWYATDCASGYYYICGFLETEYTFAPKNMKEKIPAVPNKKSD